MVQNKTMPDNSASNNSLLSLTEILGHDKLSLVASGVKKEENPNLKRKHNMEDFMSKYSKKLVAVLNEKVEPGVVMNTLAHMAVGLGASIEEKDELRLIDYADADGNSHANISELPFIVLRAKNSNRLRELRKKLVERGVHFVDFPGFVQEIGTFEDPEKSRQMKEEDIEYYGIAMFGDWDTVTELTKKFSLWK